jgi:predicted nucleotidyltransferase
MAETELQKERDRAHEARLRLPSVAALLVERFGVRRIVLFGSLLEGRLHERSDIDLGVEGLAPERYWEALWRCAAAAGRHVDLVPLEDVGDSLRAHIAAFGEVLHG